MQVFFKYRVVFQLDGPMIATSYGFWQCVMRHSPLQGRTRLAHIAMKHVDHCTATALCRSLLFLIVNVEFRTICTSTQPTLSLRRQRFPKTETWQDSVRAPSFPRMKGPHCARRSNPCINSPCRRVTNSNTSTRINHSLPTC